MKEIIPNKKGMKERIKQFLVNPAQTELPDQFQKQTQTSDLTVLSCKIVSKCSNSR